MASFWRTPVQLERNRMAAFWRTPVQFRARPFRRNRRIVQGLAFDREGWRKLIAAKLADNPAECVECWTPHGAMYTTHRQLLGWLARAQTAGEFVALDGLVSNMKALR